MESLHENKATFQYLASHSKVLKKTSDYIETQHKPDNIKYKRSI